MFRNIKVIDLNASMVVANDALLLQVGQRAADGFGAYAKEACNIRLGHGEMQPAPVISAPQQLALAKTLDEAQQALFRAQLPAVEQQFIRLLQALERLLAETSELHAVKAREIFVVSSAMAS